MSTDNAYFTVFGGSYVAEQHNDRFDVAPRRRAPSAAASWIVCGSLIAGISVFAAEIAVFAYAAI